MAFLASEKLVRVPLQVGKLRGPATVTGPASGPGPQWMSLDDHAEAHFTGLAAASKKMLRHILTI